MRRPAALLVLALAATVKSQTHLGWLPQSVAVALERSRTAPTQPASPPGQGTGQAEPENQDQIRILRADSVTRTGTRIKLSGSVQAQYKGYDLFATEIEGDTESNLFVLKGGARLIGPDAALEGETIEINFDTESFRVTQGSAELRPKLLGGRTQDDIYLRGSQAYGTEREVFTVDGDFTTCDRKDPHFHVLGSSIVVRPEKRVILRGVELTVLNHRILKLPYLSIPIDRRNERYTPEVGQSRDEGYYVKTRWGVPVAGPNAADAYLDYFTKLGTGLGGRYQYDSERSAGFLRVYGLTGDQRSLEGTAQHAQVFGPNDLTIDLNYQRQNYLNAPENTYLTTRAQMNFPQGRNNTRLAFHRSTNDGASFSSLQQTLGLTDVRSLGGSIRTNLDVRWATSESKFESTSNVKREQVDVRFRGQQELRAGSLELEYQRSIPVGETVNFFSASDRTPVLAFRTSAQKLMGPKAAGRTPFQLDLSIGEFMNPSNKQRVTRSFLDFSTLQPDRMQRRWGLSWSTRYRQGFYSDDTAQYSILTGAAFRYSFDTTHQFNLRYNRLQSRGFTPLSIDRVGESNFLSGDLSVRAARDLTLGLQSSYDFTQEDRPNVSPWQLVGARTEWRPNENFELRSVASYDPQRQVWSNLRFDLGWQSGEAFVSLGARYDGFRQQWGAVNAYFEGLKFGRLRATGVVNFNGYLKKIEAQQYLLTYDLHCAELVMQVIDNRVGFRPGREIYVFLRLKAIPYQPDFGVGRRGQPIGTGTGSGF